MALEGGILDSYLPRQGFHKLGIIIQNTYVVVQYLLTTRTQVLIRTCKLYYLIMNNILQAWRKYLAPSYLSKIIMPPLHSCWKTSATIHQKGQTLTLQMISSTNKINLKKKRSIIVQPQLASLAVWYGQCHSTLARPSQQLSNF